MSEDPGTEWCLSFLVRHAWLSMRGVVAEALAEHGLSVAQFGSLILIEEEPGLTVAELARKVSSTRQSATEMLAGLERGGLVERRPHPTDRRAQQVFMTPAGRSRLRAATPAVVTVEAQLEASFTKAEREVVRRWLTTMAAAGTPHGEEFSTA